MPVCNMKTIRLKLWEKRHFTVTIYYTIISKFQKFAKNSKIVRSSKKAQARWVISSLMPVCNMKTIQLKLWEKRRFTVTIYYTIISKFQKFAKNSKIVRSSKKAQARWVVSFFMPVCNMKTIRLKLWEKRHFTVTIYYTIISKFQKFAKNSKIVRSSKKAQARWVISSLMPVCNMKTIRLKLWEKRRFTVTIYYTIISKFQKFAKNSKIFRSTKKAQARWVISYLMPV